MEYEFIPTTNLLPTKSANSQRAGEIEGHVLHRQDTSLYSFQLRGLPGHKTSLGVISLKLNAM